MKDKVILVDVDGVLLDWEHHFERWMIRHGYEVKQAGVYCMATKHGLTRKEVKPLIRMFNESAWIRKISSLRDAVKYVRKLHEEHGYIFHVISSLSDDEYAQHLRTKNLREVFGESVFDRFTYLDTGAPKDEALVQYAGTGCWWVEDKIENVDEGIKQGLSGILMAHDHNAEYGGQAYRVQNWKQIYNIIVG